MNATPNGLERILAVDPGERYCGLAFFMGPKLTKTGTVGPTAMYEHLENWLVSDALDTVVCEKWQLYPGRMMQQAYGEQRTVEVIGVVRYLVDYCWGVKLVMQPASIKKPMEGILRHKRIKLVGKTRHSKDAELHGWHYLLNQEET